MATYIPKHPVNHVDEKMKVLEQLFVVDDKNRSSIKATLLAAIKQYPNTDECVVLDRMARKLIAERFSEDY